MNVRIIPRLDIKGPNLVKGIHFEGLRVLGKPENFARYYFEQGADELMYMDAVASLYGRNSLQAIVERTSREVFIPLCVGGGLRTVDDIRTVLRAGADKVSLNTAAIARPELIREASRAFGSSTIVVSIEAIRLPDGTYEACTDYGRQRSGRVAAEWAMQAVELGAGELVVTSIDREGTGAGYDLALTRSIADAVPIPVIAGGGAGSTAHVCAVVQEGHADAVSLASLLHYNYLRNSDPHDDDFRGEGNTEFLKGGGSFSRMHAASLHDIQRALNAVGVECRIGGAS
ncbi:MAG: imidazole glycerol phosphate synthase cyclase subunit [Acidobacteriota bacterium]|nr:imidazole glycerol phosphate synthase cyclase subunit [Acidobacteriota bacterium]